MQNSRLNRNFWNLNMQVNLDLLIGLKTNSFKDLENQKHKMRRFQNQVIKV